MQNNAARTHIRTGVKNKLEEDGVCEARKNLRAVPRGGAGVKVGVWAPNNFNSTFKVLGVGILACINNLLLSSKYHFSIPDFKSFLGEHTPRLYLYPSLNMSVIEGVIHPQRSSSTPC